MEKQKLDSISRRQFIGSIMLVSTTSTLSGVLLSACNTFSKTSPWLIGCYTRAWGSRNYLIALDGMVEAGYKYVGLSTHDKGRVIDRDTAPDIAFQVGEEIKKRGLKLVALSGGTFDSNAPVSEGIEQLKRLIDNAERCGAPLIQLNDIVIQVLAATLIVSYIILRIWMVASVVSLYKDVLVIKKIFRKKVFQYPIAKILQFNIEKGDYSSGELQLTLANEGRIVRYEHGFQVSPEEEQKLLKSLKKFREELIQKS